MHLFFKNIHLLLTNHCSGLLNYKCKQFIHTPEQEELIF